MSLLTIPFVVEGVMVARSAVFCRRLEPIGFAMTPGTLLAGCPVREVDQPRKVMADGSIDTEFFAFLLADDRDVNRFPTGEQVLLTGFDVEN